MNYIHKLAKLFNALQICLEDGILVAAISLTLITFFSNINIAAIINFFAIAVAYLYRGVRKDFIAKKQRACFIALLFLILLIFSYFTPIDICVRQNVNNGVYIRFVPLCVVNGAYEKQRTLERQGLKKNIDFVVYDRYIGERYPQYVILISFPYLFRLI